MSDSWHFHGSFMAVSWHFHIQAWPGYSLPKSIEKRFLEIGFPCRFGFFCDFSIIILFFAICQIHVGFMALSWHFLHPDFWVFSWKNNPNQQLDSSQKWRSSLNVRFIANSSRIHVTFMSLSCQFHSYVGFIADSCHFHVTFNQTELQTVSWQFHGTLSTAY